MCRLDRSRSVEKSLIPRNTGAEKQAPTCVTVIQTWLIYYLFIIIVVERHTLQCKPFFGKNVQYKCHDRH